MRRAHILFLCVLSLCVLGAVAESKLKSKAKGDRSLLQTREFTPRGRTRHGRRPEHFRRIRTRAARPGVWNGRVFQRRRARRRFDSASIQRLTGVLQIRVVGTGDACLVRIIDRRVTYRQQFGDTTDTSAFIDMYGLGICEDGAVGRAYGRVEASVIATAYQNGEECLASVVSEVMVEVHDPDPNDGVSIEAGGVANGTALAVCENTDTNNNN